MKKALRVERKMIRRQRHSSATHMARCNEHVWEVRWYVVVLREDGSEGRYSYQKKRDALRQVLKLNGASGAVPLVLVTTVGFGGC